MRLCLLLASALALSCVVAVAPTVSADHDGCHRYSSYTYCEVEAACLEIWIYANGDVQSRAC